MESGHSSIVMEKMKKGLVRNHIAFAYEDICREQTCELNAQGVWPFYFSEIGRYWDAKTEVDVVALDPEGKNMILGEYCGNWRKNGF